MTARRRWLGLAVLGLATSWGPAGCRRRGSAAQAACAAPVTEWVARCASQQHFEVASTMCPEDGVALIDLRGEPRLRVELRRGAGAGFRRVGAWGVSPVGNFADWSRVHPHLQEGFDKVTACVRADENIGVAGRPLRASQAAPARAPARP